MEYTQKTCKVCTKQFKIPKFRIKHGRGQTCSPKCRWKLHSQRMTMEGNARWKGGISFMNGYKVIYRPSHPHAKASGYIFEHRLIVEKSIGRYLWPKEVVHHINEDKLDNRIENLLITNSSEHHSKFHKIFNCKFCNNSHFARNMCAKHYQRWYRKLKPR